jgi:hypothetical protein
MIHSALVIIALVLVSSNTQAQIDFIASCKSSTYSHDNNNSSMSFSLVEGISYDI